MRIKKQVVERECDSCGKVTSDNGELSFGGSVFNGWFFLEKTSVSTIITDGIYPNRGLDFCSVECLANYVRKLN